MSRIAITFEKLRSSGRKGFIPFVSAGDPDLDTSKAIVLALAKTGADIIELGMPFNRLPHIVVGCLPHALRDSVGDQVISIEPLLHELAISVLVDLDERDPVPEKNGR